MSEQKQRKPYGGGLYGNGPWRILDDCPALRHNTLRASAGRVGSDNRREDAKCVCPRALALREQDAARVRTRERLPSSRVKPLPSEKAGGGHVPSYMRNILNPDMPDLRNGLCQTPAGRELINNTFDNKGFHNSRAVKAAKKMCKGCPRLERCQQWVLRDEFPGGSWLSVYGGLSARERQELFKRNWVWDKARGEWRERSNEQATEQGADAAA